MIPALVGRINYSGELGYELWVAPEYQRALFDQLMAAGEEYGIRLFGFRALMSLRLEKSYGTWYREYRPIYTLHEAGLQRYVKLDHEFIGRAAYEKEAETGPERRLVAFVVEPDPDEPADVIGDEPIWHDGAVVGWVTSGAYGHHVKESIALGYVPTALADARRPGRERLRDRDHRAAPAGPAPARAVVRPAGCADAPVTEVAPAAAEDATPGGVAGRIVVDGRPVRVRAGRFGGDGDPARRGGPGARRDAVPGRGLRELPRPGRWHRVRPDVPDRGAARDCAVARHPAGAMPALPVVAATDLTATPLPAATELHHLEVDVAVIGGGSSGRAAAADAERAGRTVRVLDAGVRRGGRGDLRRTDDRRPDAGRDAPRPSARDRRRDRRRRDPSGLPGQPAGRDRDGTGRRAAA